MESKERIESLDRSLITYGKALRWGDYEEAALYRLPRDGRPVRSVNRDDFKDMRVSSYQVFEQRFNRAQTEARVAALNARYQRGHICEAERHSNVVDEQRLEVVGEPGAVNQSEDAREDGSVSAAPRCACLRDQRSRLSLPATKSSRSIKRRRSSRYGIPMHTRWPHR